MGKVAKIKDQEASKEKPDFDRKKRKRRKDLEELRRNSLAVKYDLRKRGAVPKPSKSRLTKTLNDFSQKREENDQKTQNVDLNLKKPKIISNRLLPEPLFGLFKNGAKGVEIKRKGNWITESTKARLNGDILKLLRSDEPILRKSPPENSNITGYLSKQLGETDSRVDEETVEESSVPKLNGKKKNPRILSSLEESLKSIDSSNVPNQALKECKRRLFESEDVQDIAGCSKQEKAPSVGEIWFSPRVAHSCPKDLFPVEENVIHEAHQSSTSRKVLQINPTVIHKYEKLCQFVNNECFEDLALNFQQDPLDKTVTALRQTHAKSYQHYIEQKKSTIVAKKGVTSTSVESQATTSSSFETLADPDSAIIRTVKKNIAVQKNMRRSAERVANDLSALLQGSGHEDTDGDIDYVETLSIEFPPEKYDKVPSPDLTEDNALKRKRSIPSSTQVNVDPRSSVRSATDLTDEMWFTRRFLNINDGMKQKPLQKREVLKHGLQRNIKHVPTILRRSSRYVECRQKEKKFTIEDLQRFMELNQSHRSFTQTTDPDLTCERTPHLEKQDQAVKVLNCKVNYMKSKYNQPPRLSMEKMQRKSKVTQTVPERCLFSTPLNSRKKKANIFAISEDSELKTTRIHRHKSNVVSSDEKLKLSQGSDLRMSQGSVEEVRRGVSFGDIQDKTSRLNLRSEVYEAPSHVSNANYIPQHPHRQNVEQYLATDNYSSYKVPVQRSSSTYNAGRLQQSDQNYQAAPMRNSQDHVMQVNGDLLLYQDNPSQSVSQPGKFMAVGEDQNPRRYPIYLQNDRNMFVPSSTYTNCNVPSNVRYASEVYGNQSMMNMGAQCQRKLPSLGYTSGYPEMVYRQPSVVPMQPIRNEERLMSDVPAMGARYSTGLEEEQRLPSLNVSCQSELPCQITLPGGRVFITKPNYCQNVVGQQSLPVSNVRQQNFTTQNIVRPQQMQMSATSYLPEGYEWGKTTNNMYNVPESYGPMMSHNVAPNSH